MFLFLYELRLEKDTDKELLGLNQDWQTWFETALEHILDNPDFLEVQEFGTHLAKYLAELLKQGLSHSC